MKAPENKRVPLAQFLGDSALFGLGGMADRLIGFLFLPITASILGGSGFGVYNLYATASSILFILCSIGMHSAYFRFATDDSVSRDGLPVLNAAISVIHLTTLLWIPPALYLAAPLADWLVGVPEPWFIYWLCLRTYSDILGSLADCKLHADGKLKLFLALRLPITLIVRACSLAALIHYRTPLALASGEALAAAVTTIPMAAYVMRAARPQINRKLVGDMVRYGGGAMPGLLSAWLLIAASRYLLKAFGPESIRDVGIFSLAERFSSLMLLLGQTLWLGWRRFAFRNMHLPDGPEAIAKGMTLYFAAAGFGALGVSMLGPLITLLLINPEFAPAAPLIAPLTLAAFLSAVSNPLKMGLIKENRTFTMSSITLASAIVSIALALWLIPSHAGAGAVAGALAGQIVGVWLSWMLAQRSHPIPFEADRLGKLALWFLGAYGLSLLLEPLGALIALAGGGLTLAALPFALYRYGPLTAYERNRIAAAVQPVLLRFRRAGAS